MGTTSTTFPRDAAAVLEDRLRRAPVVVLTGARQTGKSTLVRSRRGDAARRSMTLDSLAALDQARSAPDALFEPGKSYAIDEVQRAPELLLAVKRAVDADRRPGAFILTGSSNLLLMKGVSETLAGRTAHIALRPMTPRELRRAASPAPWSAFLDATDAATAVRVAGPASGGDWHEAALSGGFPPAALAPSADDRAAWFDAYVETYVQRDVRESARIGDLPAFARLVRLLSLRNGGLVNYADLASDCGLPRTTVQRWVALLETSYLATVLPPYFESSAKRLIKTPKLYTLDTGLGLHLAGVETKTDLKSMQQRGVWLEQLVLNDLLVWRDLELRKPQLYFYRTAGGEEIDFVVAKGRRFLPIEIKASTAPRTSDAKPLESFCTESGPRAPFGLLLYDGPEAYRLTEHVVAVPLRCIF